MTYYKAYGLSIRAQIPLPELSIGESTEKPDLKVVLTTISLPKLKKTNIHRRGVRADFGINEQGDLILHWQGVANFQAMGGHTLGVEPLVDDENIISLFTVSEALGLILFQRGLFLLHASSVQVGDEAWCFMGQPGAGKSTTAAAFIKAGSPLLSDDLTAIQFDDRGQPWIIPAYPQLKIWETTVHGLNYDSKNLAPVSEGVNKFSFQPKEGFQHDPLPLKRVFFLHKARNRPYMDGLSAASIPVELLKHFPLPLSLVQNDALKDHFSQSFLISRHAALWRKRRDKSFSALEDWVAQVNLNVMESREI
ncbi:serine kinase [Dyadobacter tibetensis]|uniref:serine kinase n=1 Tax=Dyadobacter tibetensis TaxID=1211851 RepID=UPI00046FFCF7|nr:serine kinase [Dyadobacter tibetensis]